MLDRRQAPHFQEIREVSFLAPQTLTLKNGVQVFLFNSGEQEIVRLQWVFENTSFDPLKPLVNSALAGMLLEGTDKLSSAEIAEQADFYGAFLHPEYNYDRTTLTLFALRKHLQKLLPLVFEVLTSADFPEKELKNYILNNKQRMKISMERKDYLARKEFNHAIFGESRYGFFHTEEDYSQLKREDLLVDFQNKIIPKNCKLFISGKLDSALLEQVYDLFGNRWTSSKEKPVVHVEIPDQPEVKTLVINKEDALQSAIRMGCQSIGRSHADFPGLQFVNTLLGGYFGSRLMTNIREEKGYTYGIGSGIGSLEHASFFTIASEVGVEVTQATLVEIEKEINKLREELVGEDELSLVKNYMLGALMGSLENVFSHTDKFKQAYFSEVGLSYYDYYVKTIREMTAPEIQRIAIKYLDYSKMTKVIVGELSE